MPEAAVNVNLIEKINQILGEEKELIVLKGKLYSPTEEHRQEDNQVYYTFKLKVVKARNEDEYSQSFNTYFCIVPAEISKMFSVKQIGEMKNNEVAVLCSARAGTREFVRKDTGEKVTVNNINLYALDIMLTRQIKAESVNTKSLKI